MKGCKNCPAYAKCTVTYRGSACAALRGTYGIDSDPEIAINADRIRAMSNAEMARFIKALMFSDFKPDCKKSTFFSAEHKPECDEDCVSCIMDWLHQPAEEDI